MLRDPLRGKQLESSWFQTLLKRKLFISGRLLLNSASVIVFSSKRKHGCRRIKMVFIAIFFCFCFVRGCSETSSAKPPAGVYLFNDMPVKLLASGDKKKNSLTSRLSSCR